MDVIVVRVFFFWLGQWFEIYEYFTMVNNRLLVMEHQ